jgi:ABC-2 type transport system permease protein
MHKVNTIVRKEWAEVFRNRMVIFTVIFLPLMMAAIPLGILIGTRDTSQAGGNLATSGLPPELTQSFCPSTLSGAECMQVVLVSQFMLMFMLIPVAIPVTMAAYSIVGEKTTHSLEPLLATPITTFELLVGKCLAAVIPAALATFLAFGIMVAGAWVISANRTLMVALLDPRWLVAIFVVGPLLAVMAVAFSLRVDRADGRRVRLEYYDHHLGGYRDVRVGRFADLFGNAGVPARVHPDTLEMTGLRS